MSTEGRRRADEEIYTVKSVETFIISFVVLGALLLLMDMAVFSARGLSFIYSGP